MFSGITAHMIVKNEENWIWYAISSVLDQVDSFLIYDTGSTDNTVEIIKTFKNEKIKFKQFNNVNAEEFTKLRQMQLEETNTSHCFVIDGDEIWDFESLKFVINLIKKKPEKIAVFTHWIEFVNDIYHYYMGIEQKRYPLHNRKEFGWYMIRFFRKIENIYCDKPYGNEGYFVNGEELQRIGNENDYIWCNDIYFFHARNLLRSATEKKDNEVMLRKEKRHFNNIGKIPEIYRNKKIVYPEVFTFKTPEIVKKVF